MDEKVLQILLLKMMCGSWY